MKIQSLLEDVDLFRYQSRWKNNTDPSISMGGRETRVLSHGAVTAYAVHYALTEMVGLEPPKRWKATFATTSISQSFFMRYVHDEGDSLGPESGVRCVTIPPDRMVGWVYNDFNNMSRLYAVKDAWVNVGYQLRDMLEVLEVQQGVDIATKVAEVRELITRMDKVRYSRNGSDEGYQEFVETIQMVDKLGLDLNVTGAKGKTLSQVMIEIVDDAVTAGKIGVGSRSQVPVGNFEVWFEGDYEAQLIQPTE